LKKWKDKEWEDKDPQYHRRFERYVEWRKTLTPEQIKWYNQPENIRSLCKDLATFHGHSDYEKYIHSVDGNTEYVYPATLKGDIQ
jgi:hypothetical protein